ncbi:MAG: hypothetical protein J7647_17020 [Cyanobacteria bacterium SBLK]|nr:hypothetical protein [Cyanobacteria bacterium SBLK]
MSDHQIADISSLSRLTNLEVLSLDGNHIENVNSLDNLATLKCLDLQRNAINMQVCLVVSPTLRHRQICQF